jgi:hypothetical protein
MLYRAHTSHRAARADEIDRYFSEQWTYRQSILSMHAAYVMAGGPPLVGTSAAAAALSPKSHSSETFGATTATQTRQLFAADVSPRSNGADLADAAQAWSSSSGNQNGAASASAAPSLARRKAVPTS